MKHKYIRPNVFYATISQLIILSIYLGIAYGAFFVIQQFVDFNIIEFIKTQIENIGTDMLPFVVELVKEKMVVKFIVVLPPLMIFLYNLIVQEIDIKEDKILLRKGIFGAIKKQFPLSEIVKYTSEKELGFLNLGTLELNTFYGDKIKIEYILNLKKATQFLDEIIQKNVELRKQQMIAMQQTKSQLSQKLQQEAKSSQIPASLKEHPAQYSDFRK